MSTENKIKRWIGSFLIGFVLPLNGVNVFHSWRETLTVIIAIVIFNLAVDDDLFCQKS